MKQTEKLERVRAQTRCTCVKYKYLILNIRAILRGDKPEYDGASEPGTCPSHGSSDEREST